jgi:hypothetical protein
LRTWRAVSGQSAIGIKIKITLSLRIIRLGIGDQKHEDVHCLVIPCRHQPGEGIYAIVGPPIVRIDADKGIVGNQRQGPNQTTTCIQKQIALI